MGLSKCYQDIVSIWSICHGTVNHMKVVNMLLELPGYWQADDKRVFDHIITLSDLDRILSGRSDDVSYSISRILSEECQKCCQNVSAGCQNIAMLSRQLE